MIIGHGIDLVEIDRVSNIYAKYKENFISKYFINDQLKKIDSNLLANNFALLVIQMISLLAGIP